MLYDQTNWPWVEEDARWRVLRPWVKKLCRMRGCRAPAVAELDRSHLAKGVYWWAYCPDHLYGRRVVCGKVACQVHPDSDLAKKSLWVEVPIPFPEDFHS